MRLTYGYTCSIPYSQTWQLKTARIFHKEERIKNKRLPGYSYRENLGVMMKMGVVLLVNNKRA